MRPHSAVRSLPFALIIGLATATTLDGQAGPACPSKPGLYVLTNQNWSELPQEAAPLVVTKMSALLGVVYDKEFAGDSAFTTLDEPHDFCVVGANTATYSLEKAKVKKGKTRTIVQSGNYHDKKGDQSQQLAVLTDEQGNAHLMSHALASGQYILIVHGTISKPVKPTTSGNPTTDAMAQAMANSAAIVASLSLGGGGIYFGFGIK